ncbi:MAG TPA: tRNA (adenosine(37)-N6)-threonylcarbamoyltransferase complex transferase subunit TsaD [Sorangium sp.]|nr:tRNA (adenosine(37)-N6)-threonylcarbamoyltransferase complex transferase subunit TsaD [Sorangium sp.]
MTVLGIESSCDETAAAVVRVDGVVLAERVHSQIALHAPFGGVVPEVAARDHLRMVAPLVTQTLADAGMALAQLDAIAVTYRPGLLGALLVGVQMAKGLAWAADKPLLGVDHLVGHLLSVFLRREGEAPATITFPFIGLLVSGGHTSLYRCDGPVPTHIRELGGTRDDAVGEAYDKVAKLLGLGYPGGPAVDRLAASGDVTRARLSLRLPMMQKGSLEMSFSGIKSAVARHVRGPDGPRNKRDVADVCALFQQVVVRTLVLKTLRAAAQEKLTRVVVAGGVAANSALRFEMRRACKRSALSVVVPPLNSCTDNAAMIAYAGVQKLLAGGQDPLSLAAHTKTELPPVTRKGRGRRR